MLTPSSSRSGDQQLRRHGGDGAHFRAIPPGAEVGLDDAWVGGDLLERALRDLDAVVERDHAVGDALDDVHVVLDHEDRVAALDAELGDQLGDLLRLLRVHPGGRLVEQEQPRVRRRRAGDLEPAPVGVRERVRGLVPAVAHQPLAEEREPLLGERPDLALLAPLAGCPEDRAEGARARVAVGRRHDVLADGHVEEQAKRLERPRDPLARDQCGSRPGDALAREDDVALRRLVDAGDEVEERRLAGAVRADHADDLALVDVEVEPGDDLQAAERHRHLPELQELLRGRHQTISTRFSPSRPCGRATIIATRSAPSTM